MTKLDEMTTYQIFQEIKKLTNHLFEHTTDCGTAACCSDIRVAVNRYFKDHVPRRGD